MNRGDREIEWKFVADSKRGAEILAEFGADAGTSSRELESVYFDTADQALRKAGFTLRVRQDGRRWTQTVKSRLAADGLGRGEWEAPVSGGVPDADLVRATPAATALDGWALAPLFTVRVARRTVTLNRSGCEVEVSFDQGEVEAGTRSSLFGELECELKAGDPAVFFDLIRRPRNIHALRPNFMTKGDRGFDLTRAGTTAGARPFQAPRIAPEMTASRVFKAIAVAALEQITGDADFLSGGAKEEAVHQIRIGARLGGRGARSNGRRANENAWRRDIAPTPGLATPPKATAFRLCCSIPSPGSRWGLGRGPTPRAPRYVMVRSRGSRRRLSNRPMAKC